MNIENETLIRELATRLGTTADHLWSVLIKQAYVSSLTDVIIICVWLVILVVTGGLLYRALREEVDADALIFPIVCWLMFACFTVLVVSFSASNILSGFYNPEYWALQKVLTLLKGH